MTSLDDAAVLDALDAALVGRRRELELLVAALAADRHVLLEGPPGTGKSTMLREVAHAAGTGFVFVEGNAELTPARLAGQFDPARVLEEGYALDVFVDGPLVEALRAGALLYVEELNRVPEETVNLLISVMSEGELHLPRVGRVEAAAARRVRCESRFSAQARGVQRSPSRFPQRMPSGSGRATRIAPRTWPRGGAAPIWPTSRFPKQWT